jgi:hypothetical protein
MTSDEWRVMLERTVFGRAPFNPARERMIDAFIQAEPPRPLPNNHMKDKDPMISITLHINEIGNGFVVATSVYPGKDEGYTLLDRDETEASTYYSNMDAVADALPGIVERAAERAVRNEREERIRMKEYAERSKSRVCEVDTGVSEPGNYVIGKGFVSEKLPEEEAVEHTLEARPNILDHD